MKPLKELQDNLDKLNKPGVHLWIDAKMPYLVQIRPDNSPPFVEMFETTSFEHARGMALVKYGPGHRVMLQEPKEYI